RRRRAPGGTRRDPLDPDRGRLQLGLARDRVERRARHLIERRLPGAEVQGAPVEGRKRNARRKRVDDTCAHGGGSPPRYDTDTLAVADADAACIVRVQFDERLGLAVEELR